MDYNTKVQIEDISPDETVYIVDYSIPKEDMLRLFEITKKIFWIDHHQTAIQKYEGFPYSIAGIRGNDDESGCLLTWKWFNGDKEPPLFVKLIDDWDTWKHQLHYTEFFITAFNAELNTDPNNFMLWNNLENNSTIQNMINNGIIMLKYRDGYCKSVMKHIGAEVEFEGLKVFACNIPHANSKFFNYIVNLGLVTKTYIDNGKIVPEHEHVDYDALMPYYYDLNKHLWTYSLYSCRPEVDVGDICKKHGGGGHKNAAGFSSEKLIFEKDVT